MINVFAGIIFTGSRSQWPRGLRCGSAAACFMVLWVRIPPGHGCLPLVSVVCCQVEVSVTGRSIVQRSPTKCGVSRGTSQRRPRRTRAVGPWGKKHLLDTSRSQWPRGLRRRSTTVRLLGSWVRIPPGAWTFVCCECCVLSGRGLCDELARRPGKSYRLWCVVVCKFETSWMRSQNKAGWSVGRRLQQIDDVAI